MLVVAPFHRIISLIADEIETCLGGEKNRGELRSKSLFGTPLSKGLGLLPEHVSKLIIQNTGATP